MPSEPRAERFPMLSVLLRAGRTSWRTAVLASLLVLVGAFLLGAATSYGQTLLPSWLNPLSNSIGGWTGLAFLLVWLSRARPLLAVFLGVVAFEALNEGYGFITRMRGYDYAVPMTSVWNLVGLICGPILGLAAGYTRWGSPHGRAAGMTVLAAVLLGDSVGSLLRVADTTGPTYWILQGVAALIVLVAGTYRLAWAMRIGFIAGCLVLAAMFAAAIAAVFG